VREGWTARLVPACWSLLWLGLLLVGLPAGLISLAGWPLPDRLPAMAEVQRWAAHPLTTQALVNVVVWLLWLLWAWLVYTVAAELLRWLTRLRLPRVRWPAPLQSVTGGLVGALVLALTGSGSGPPGAAAGPSAATPPQPDHELARTRPAPLSPDVELPHIDGLGAPQAGGAGADEAAGSGAVNGVDLPGGGWASGPLAEHVAAAAAMVWWQRRRRYLPGPPMLRGRRDDPDLLDLPTTVTAIQHAVGGPVDLPPPSMTSAMMPAGGPVWPWQLPAHGVGLVGPGAADAARGLLLAALLAADRGPGTGRLLTTAADLPVLLGTSPDRYRDLPGLTVVDSIEDVLTELAVTGARAPAGDRRVPVAGRGRPPADGTAGPLIVLLVAAPDGRRRRQLTALVASPADPARGAPVRRLAVLGAWPSGTTWRVDADGTVFATNGEARVAGRLSVLSPAAAVDLLTLLTTLAAHGRPPAQLVNEGQTAQAVPAGIATARPAQLDHRPAAVSAVVDLRSEPEAALGKGQRAMIGPPLRLRVLGAVQLRQRTGAIHRHPGLDDVLAGDGPTDGERELRLPRSAALQIAAYLAAHPDGVTGAALSRAVWPGVPAPASRLRTTLSALRIGLDQAAGRPVLRRDGDRYRLDPDTVEVDLWQVQAAVDRAARALTADARHTALREVVAGYTGEFALGETWPWLPAHREAARRHVIDALSALANAAPDQHTAIGLLHQAVGHDPDNEHLHRELMHTQAATGDRDGVAHTYRRLARRLADHGADPSTTTSELARWLTGDTLPAEDTTRR
jgi:DNA-binding SARP family transcriptional activator